MPKVEIPIGGYSQSVDERKNPPRITRLMNCRVDGGALKMTPGTVTITNVNVGSSETTVTFPIKYGMLASGSPYCIAKQTLNEDLGMCLFAGSETTTGNQWRKSTVAEGVTLPRKVDQIEYDENPIVTPVFTDPSVHYESPGVIDLGSSGFVVLGEGLKNFVEAGGTFDVSQIHYAVFSPGELTPASRGIVSGGGSWPKRRYLAVAGKCAAYYYQDGPPAQIVIRKFDSTTMAWSGTVLAIANTSVTCGARTNIDLAYDSYLDRYLLVDSIGDAWLYDSSLTLLRSFSFAPAGMVAGTLGVAIASGPSYSGRTYICYRVAETWYLEVWQVTNSTSVRVSGPTALYLSPSPISASDPVAFRWQAAVSAIEGAGTATNPNLVACSVHGDYPSPSPTSGTGIVILRDHTTASIGYPIDTFRARHAAKPFIHTYPFGDTSSSPHVSIWSYETTWRKTATALFRFKDSGDYFTDTLRASANAKYPRLVSIANRGGTNPPMTSLEYVGHVNPTVATTVLPPKENAQYRKGWLTAVMRRKDAFRRTCDVLLVSQVDGTTSYTYPCNIPDILQQADARETSLFASALPSQVFISPESNGHQYVPSSPLAVSGGIGAVPASGTYLYCTVKEWKDSAGNINRSPPSDPVSFYSGGGSIDLTLFDDPWDHRLFSNGGSSATPLLCRTKLYRTKASGTVFYLLETFDDVGATHVNTTYTDVTADSSLSSREILYTQADRGGLSGMLEWWGAPGCRCIWSGIDRMIAGGLENPNRVRWSNLFFPGEGISWPEHEAFFCDLPESIVAVGCLGGTWLAWSNRALYAITGQGPDAFGQGAFDTPTKVADVGAHSWRSLVQTPLGIFFQGEDKQVYLASTGQYGSVQVQMVSGDIRNSIGQAPEDHSGLSSVARARRVDRYEYTGNWIRSAVYDADLREVWFGEFVDRAWVYSLDSGSWRSEVDYQHSAGHYLLSGGITKAKASSVQGAGYVDFWKPAFVRTNFFSSLGTLEAYRVRSSSEVNAYVDAAGNWRYMGFWTSDIDLDHGRIKRIWINQDREELWLEATPYTVRADLHLWYDGYRGELDPEDTMSVSHDAAAANVNRFLNSEFCPARQKCNEFRFAYVVNPQTHPNLSWQITGIVLDVESTGLKQQRVPSVGRGA